MRHASYLVYTNDKERAIIFASVLGGVVAENTIIHYENLDDYHDVLMEMLEQDGFLISVFNAVPYIFVYSKRGTIDLNRMSDYSDDYKKIDNRPVPFPEQYGDLEYRIIDKELWERMENYFSFIPRGVKSIVNAATDDIQGDMDFIGFQFMLSKKIEEHGYVMRNESGEVDFSPLNKYFRANPRSMTQKSICEAFATMDVGREQKRICDAADLNRKVNWLIAANGSNLIYQKTKKVFVIGRLESPTLHRIAMREKRIRKAEKSWHIEADIEIQDEATGVCVPIPYTARVTGLFQSGEDAKKKAGTLPSVLDCSFFKFECETDHHVRLFSTFTAQIEAVQQLGISFKEAQASLNRLYLGGYISWPSESDSLPWYIRSECKASVDILKQYSQYARRIKQRDIDNYTAWGKDPTDETAVNHSGLLITRYAEEGVKDLQETDLKIYHLIAERFVNVFTKKTEMTKLVIGANGPDTTMFLHNETEYNADDVVPLLNVLEQGDALSEKKKIIVKEYRVAHDEVPDLFTELSLTEDLLPEAAGGFYNNASFFSSIIKNLIDWKLIKKNDKGYLITTKRGRKEDIYIDGTTLSDLTTAFDWDRRIFQSIKPPPLLKQKGEKKLIEGVDRVGVDYVLSDVYIFLKDLTDDLTARYAELTETENIELDECVCPICGDMVVKTEDGSWKCSDDSCSFQIPADYYGHSLTWLDVWKLLSKGRTDRLSDFVSQRTKEKFEARIIIAPDHKIAIDFNSPFRCPVCGEAMQEWSWGVKCKNNKCQFSMNTTICGVKLPDEFVGLMMNHKQTPLIHNFKNKKGTTFAAKLSLENGKIKFDFPPKDATM